LPDGIGVGATTRANFARCIRRACAHYVREAEVGGGTGLWAKRLIAGSCGEAETVVIKTGQQVEGN